MSLRPGSLITCVAAACALTAGPAGASLLPGLPTSPPSTGTVTGTVGTVTGTVGGVVGTVTGSTGTGSVTDTLGGAIDGVLAAAPGSTGGSLPTGTVGGIIDQLLGDGGGGDGSTGGGTTAGGGTTSSGGGSATGGSTTGGSTSGGGSAGGVVSGPAYNANDGADHTAPSVSYKLLSKLRTAAKTGKLRLRVHASEASVVAFTTLLRPGRARRVHGRPLAVSRKLIRIKAVVLAFRRAGSLTVVLKLPKSARRNLGRTTDARVALQSWATDVARNQTRRNVKRIIKR
jgi:hypothetical protein